MFGSNTRTGTSTVSPGTAVTSEICQRIAPSGAVTVVVVVVVVPSPVDVEVVVVSTGAEVEVVVVTSVDVVDVEVVVSSSMMIAPSTKLILAVISAPFVSDTNASVQLIGYSPGLAVSLTLYVSLITVEPSLASTPSPILFAKANSLVSLLNETGAEYASEPAAPASAIGSDTGRSN